MKGTTVLLEECLLVLNHQPKTLESWTNDSTPGYCKLRCSWQEKGSWMSIYFLENMYCLPCHLLFYQKWGCIDPVFFPWFRRPWQPVRSRVSVLPAWTLRCCDGLKVKIFRGVDGETTSSMGVLGHLRILGGKLEHGKCERVYWMTNECSYTVLNVLYCSGHVKQYTAWMTDSVMIYIYTFWFTILSIILSDCFFTMCNTGGTYECTVFIYLWLCCWGYLLGLL